MDRCALLALSVLGLVLLLSWFPVGSSASSRNGIKIRIEAGATLDESIVTATGQLVNIIADSERASFGIGSDADLKRVVGNYFGRQPDEAYLRGPTPSNNTYSRNGWEEVKRVLVPTKAEILNVVSNPTIMARKILKNNSDKKATFSTKFSKQVSNSVSNEWSNSETISVGESIGIDLIFASSETTIGLDLSFGQSNTESQETTLGTETEVTVELKPGESAIADLSASSGKMNVRITYEAYLTGSTALHYNDKYNDRLDWQLDIQDVLRGSNKVEISENIELDYYSNVATNLG